MGVIVVINVSIKFPFKVHRVLISRFLFVDIALEDSLFVFWCHEFIQCHMNSLRHKTAHFVCKNGLWPMTPFLAHT